MALSKVPSRYSSVGAEENRAGEVVVPMEIRTGHIQNASQDLGLSSSGSVDVIALTIRIIISSLNQLE